MHVRAGHTDIYVSIYVSMYVWSFYEMDWKRNQKGVHTATPAAAKDMHKAAVSDRC